MPSADVTRRVAPDRLFAVGADEPLPADDPAAALRAPCPDCGCPQGEHYLPNGPACCAACADDPSGRECYRRPDPLVVRVNWLAAAMRSMDPHPLVRAECICAEDQAGAVEFLAALAARGLAVVSVDA